VASAASVSPINKIGQQASSAERFFQWSLFLLLLTGFGSLASTGKLDLLSLAVVLPALFLRGRQLARGETFVIPETWTNYLTIFYFVFYAIDYFFLSQGFVSATVHMVLFIMVVKIFAVQRDRDLLYLAVLSFLMVLAAAVLTVDTMFFFTFSLFALAAMATFVSMEMWRSERAAGVLGSVPKRPGLFHRSLSGMALLLAVGTLTGSVAFFFIIPRVNSGGYLRSMGVQSEMVSGFSNTINLGGIGKIQQSNLLVMHVQVVSGRLPDDVKWRGVTLQDFDGRRWWNPQPSVATTHLLRNAPLELTQLKADGALLYGGSPRVRHVPTVSYRVVMEPVDTSVFFLASTPTRMSGPYDEVAISYGGSVMLVAEEGRRLDSYNGESDLRDFQALARNSTSGDYPAAITTRYLELPDLDPRIPALAQQITASSGTNYERAKAVESFLQQTFGYTLELPGPEDDPLAHFLFERKKGHCEYFASAMAVLLRTLSIPTRVVNGFRGGTYNDLNGTYMVRGRDAHSWVEVYFPEVGWVTFDPTPAAPAEAAPVGWARMALYLDAARQVWREWIINYDFSHQVRLSMQIGTKANAAEGKVRFWSTLKYGSLLRYFRRWQGSVRDFSIPHVTFTIITLLALLALPFLPKIVQRIKRARILRNPGRAPSTAASFWYLRMLRIVSRQGFSKSPGQTPLEFAFSIEDPVVRKSVMAFTEHYRRARFADSADDAKLLPGLCEDLAYRK